MENRDPLTERIIGCCFKVHRELGPGFNERIYHNALKLAFEQEGLQYQTEKELKVFFQDNYVGKSKVDLIVENKVIVEIKALAGNIPSIFEAQVISYLRASGFRIGLLVNFGNKSCQVKRIVV
ncbi:MAG: GxxExxY protein [bacterium]|nr:GxxExxY protein [bacterium]